jgi:hypothetical protein
MHAKPDPLPEVSAAAESAQEAFWAAVAAAFPAATSGDLPPDAEARFHDESVRVVEEWTRCNVGLADGPAEHHPVARPRESVAVLTWTLGILCSELGRDRVADLVRGMRTTAAEMAARENVTGAHFELACAARLETWLDSTRMRLPRPD